MRSAALEIDTASEGTSRGIGQDHGVHDEEGQAMTDSRTKKGLRVSNDGTAGPYIMVPVSQLEDIRQLLESRNIPFWVEEDAISLDGAPEVAVVNLGRGADPAAVQAVLDSVH
jgi:hypothetical protein